MPRDTNTSLRRTSDLTSNKFKHTHTDSVLEKQMLHKSKTTVYNILD